MLTACRVSVIDASTGDLVSTVPAVNVFKLGFSPLGTYIITWQLPSKDEAGNANKNLKVWKTLPDEAEAGGGLLVDDTALTPEWVRENVLPVLTDQHRLLEMSRAAAEFGRRDADEALVAMVHEAIAARRAA